jgi:hypothetical protein
MRPTYLTPPILALCAALSLIACDDPADTPDSGSPDSGAPDSGAPDSGALDMAADQSVAPDMADALDMEQDQADDPDLTSPLDMAPDQADAPDIAPDMMADDMASDMDVPDIPRPVLVVEPGCDVAAAPFGGGDGSAAAPFLICTPAQLSAIRGAADIYHYRLAGDLDMYGVSWSAIPFMAGDLDGGGHTIYDLRHHSTDPFASGTGGLINIMSGAGIHDLTIDGLDLSAIGPVAGVVYSIDAGAGGGAVRNVRVKRARIVAQDAPQQLVFAAGILGGLNGVLEDLSFEGTIEVQNTTAALTRSSAMIAGSLTGRAQRLYAKGTMTLGPSRHSGGLIGELSLGAKLTDSTADVEMSGSGGLNGGLVGIMQHSSRLERCVAKVRLTGVGPDATNMGGAVGIALGVQQGQTISRAVINQVSIEGDVEGRSAGGLVGNLSGGALTNARFKGTVTSNAPRNSVPGAGCMVASFAGISGVSGQASYVLALCAAQQQGSNTEQGVGGATGDYSAIASASVSELRWDSDQTPQSGFRNTDPSVRGVPGAMLLGAGEYSGWSQDAWYLAPNALPLVKLDPPAP